MHTPTHVLVNLAVLGKKGRRWAVVAGAVAPDLPAIAAQLYGRLLGVWPPMLQHQATTVLHSIPAALLLLAAGIWRRWEGVTAFALSLLLHDALDAPFHHGDALRHLWPLSDYRFISPLSWWDDTHHAVWVRLLEMLLVLGSSLVLWRRHPSRTARAALVVTCAVMAALLASGRPPWAY